VNVVGIFVYLYDNRTVKLVRIVLRKREREIRNNDRRGEFN
jgi:hypothetical protein